MAISDLFKDELELIEYQAVKDYTKKFLDTEVPIEFTIRPASSSGKYHPTECNLEGGLVTHTKYVVRSCMILLEGCSFIDYWNSICIAACILHDAFKYGKDGKSEYTESNHATLLSDYIYIEYSDSYIMQDIAMCIKSHMGKWSGYDPSVMNEYQKVVHFADLIASRVHRITES